MIIIGIFPIVINYYYYKKKKIIKYSLNKRILRLELIVLIIINKELNWFTYLSNK